LINLPPGKVRGKVIALALSDSTKKATNPTKSEIGELTLIASKEMGRHNTS